jgi:ElaB/YqjD/DUF883 family membrane-anchored ribosome-binding protein
MSKFKAFVAEPKEEKTRWSDVAFAAAIGLGVGLLIAGIIFG